MTTAEGIANLWTQLEAEYFLGFIVTDWYYISHIFTNPVYYISYGVSVFSVLEIFVQGLEDYDAAVNLCLVLYTLTTRSSP